MRKRRLFTFSDICNEKTVNKFTPKYFYKGVINMNLRKILSLIVSSAMLTSSITANTANAVTSTSVPKTETVLTATEDMPSSVATTTVITTTTSGTTTTAITSTTTSTTTVPDVIIPKSGTCGENLTWTLDSDGLLTISGKGPMPDRCISDYYIDIKKATKVIINDGVTSIGNYAFLEFHDLKSISIPDTVTSIGDRALSFCYRLKSIDIPNSVVSIGEGALSYCAGFESITIPSSVTEIKDYTFSYSKNLKTVILPDTITSIGLLAFGGCDRLESVNIPDSVISIGSHAFSDCISLKSITVPDSVRSLSKDAFLGCINLESISLPDNLSVAVTTVTASRPIKTTETSTLTTNAVKTTITTSDLKSITTQTLFDFKEVVSYPTKTIYEEGEYLDLTGLKVAASWCLDENYIWKTNFSVHDKYLFIVTDEKGNKVTGNDFNTLPAGEYTVSYNGVLGSNYSSHYIRNIELSFPVTIKERVQNTGTPMASTTTTTTTQVRTDFCTRAYSTFKSVVSYPTKTVYEVGDNLDISGIVISIGKNSTYNEDVFSINFFEIIDKDGKKVNGSQFNTLPSGEYTVISGNSLCPESHPIIIDDVDVSYKVTIKENDKITSSTTTTTTTTVDPYYRFRRVATYPTKTDYKVGESLEIKGLKIISSRNSDKNNEALYSEDFFNADDFEVRDKGGNTVSGDRFSTLPAGNYTVCYTGSISDDGNYTCPDIKLSYLVKIYESSEFPNNAGDQPPFLWGDTNLDGEVDMADAVLIMQYLSNPDKYGLDGTYSRHITQLGMSRCDVDISGKGITSNDALRIQKYLLNKVPNLDPYC